MSSGRITNRAAAEAFAAASEAMPGYDFDYAPDGLLEADVDRLIDDVDRELAAAGYTETVRVSREFTDQRRARRAARRDENAVLRPLLTEYALIAGMAAQGKSVAALELLLSDGAEEGAA